VRLAFSGAKRVRERVKVADGGVNLDVRVGVDSEFGLLCKRLDVSLENMVIPRDMQVVQHHQGPGISRRISDRRAEYALALRPESRVEHHIPHDRVRVGVCLEEGRVENRDRVLDVDVDRKRTRTRRLRLFM